MICGYFRCIETFEQKQALKTSGEVGVDLAFMKVGCRHFSLLREVVEIILLIAWRRVWPPSLQLSRGQ